MVFDIITIFPSLFDNFLKEGLLGKGIKKKLLEVNVHDLRDWDKVVDDKPFGGGIGMVMRPEPILRAVADIKKSQNSRIILFGPAGKKFRQSTAKRLTDYDQIIMIAGRYEGVDERIAKHLADEVLSIGDYVLMGGDIPAMAVVETIARLIPDLIGKEEFLSERTSGSLAIEYPQYTRPAVLNPKEIVPSLVDKKSSWKVPKVLLSGNHKEIQEWRESHGRIIR